MIRTVEPFKLVFKKRDWYLRAYCCSKEDWRFFKLSRINDYQLLEETINQKNVIEPIDTSIKMENLMEVSLRMDVYMLKPNCQSTRVFILTYCLI